MTIASDLNKHTYEGNGATTEWPYTFTIFNPSDIQVIITDSNGTDVILDSGFAVDEYNSLVIYPHPVGDPLTNTEKITLNRKLPITQETSLPNAGPYFAKTVETAFDRATIIAQQLQEQIDRTLKLAISVPSGVSRTMPSPVARQVLRWNETGTQLENAPPGEDYAAQAGESAASAAQSAATVGGFLNGTGIANVADIISKGPSVDIRAFENLVVDSDWTAAIQAANDHLIYGGQIRFPGRLSGYQYGNINVGDNIAFVGENGAMLIPKNDTQGFDLTDTTRVKFLYLIFNCGLQTAEHSKAIIGDNVTKLWMFECELQNGFNGLYLSNVIDSVVEQNHAYGFSGWPFWVEGCDGFKYLKNRSHNNTYDGLKLAGSIVGLPVNLLKNFEVAGNICYLNARDGFDLAGNNIENGNVHGNILFNNTLKGIDFKHVYQGDYMRHIQIYDNLLIENGNGDINFRNDILTFSVSHADIYNNRTFNSSRASNDSIVVCGVLGTTPETCDVNVKGNTVNGQACAVRVIDSNYVKVSSNDFSCGTFGVWLEKQQATAMTGNIVEHNHNITTDTNSPVYISQPEISGTIVRHNGLKCPTTVYEISDLGTGTIAYMNSLGYASSIPSRKATKGTIIYNTSVADGGCLGWIAVTKGDPATFKPWGMIGVMPYQAASVATDVATLKTDFNALLTKLKNAGLMANS
jgi:hypothetical protein